MCTQEGLSAGEVAQAPGRPRGDVNVDGNVQLDVGVLGRVRYTETGLRAATAGSGAAERSLRPQWCSRGGAAEQGDEKGRPQDPWGSQESAVPQEPREGN